MKIVVKLFLFVVLVVFWGCNSQNKSKEIESYQYEEETVEMSEEFRKIVPEWVEEGKICYGLVVQLNNDGVEIKGKPIKAKVVQIGANHIKMKALEKVSMAKSEKCDKMGILKGEVWDEKAGDFYLTREDAIQVLKEKNIYFDRATVD